MCHEELLPVLKKYGLTLATTYQAPPPPQVIFVPEPA